MLPQLPPANIVDYVCLIIIGIGFIQGVIRGLSGELAQFIGTIVSFSCGLIMYRPIGEWFSINTRLSANSALALAFISVIVISAVIMILIRSILKKIFELAVNKSVDRIGGALAGTIKSIFFILIIFWFMNLVPHDYLNRKFGEESITGTLLKPLITAFNEKYGSYSNQENGGKTE